jgi:chromosome segregation ATPase
VVPSAWRHFERLCKWRKQIWKNGQPRHRPRSKIIWPLRKYTRGDELKIRDLIREQERLTLAVAERRKQLEKEVTETKAKQVELDKLAEDFRAMHSERQSLIRQWQDNLNLVQRRDLDIAKSAEHFARAKAAVQERRQKLHEQETIIARLQTENEEMEVKIGQRTRAVGLLRDDLTQTTERVNRFRDDVELLKTNVTAAASEVTQRRNTITSAVANVKERERQIEHSRNMLEDVRSRLAHATAQVASTETALSERENYMEREQGRVDQAERRLALLKDQYVHTHTRSTPTHIFYTPMLALPLPLAGFSKRMRP